MSQAQGKRDHLQQGQENDSQQQQSLHQRPSNQPFQE